MAHARCCITTCTGHSRWIFSSTGINSLQHRNSYLGRLALNRLPELNQILCLRYHWNSLEISNDRAQLNRFDSTTAHVLFSCCAFGSTTMHIALVVVGLCQHSIRLRRRGYLRETAVRLRSEPWFSLKKVLAIELILTLYFGARSELLAEHDSRELESIIFLLPSNLDVLFILVRSVEI
ncbi:hypothetical protein DFH08DRAFT_906161 [Mycena albidolilacea]|uniref:Uncharacterized protein n=1 Tax=Mycena albidolilacea TaxID=1033008 RepID=A0AAD7E7I9_9AGAR|nr:hypothetical protein DFH08DRAFT_906161 [Mycena albidolilacea]